jgi:hypothetical protein
MYKKLFIVTRAKYYNVPFRTPGHGYTGLFDDGFEPHGTSAWRQDPPLKRLAHFWLSFKNPPMPLFQRGRLNSDSLQRWRLSGDFFQWRD